MQQGNNQRGRARGKKKKTRGRKPNQKKMEWQLPRGLKQGHAGSTYGSMIRTLQGNAIQPTPRASPYMVYRIRQQIATFGTQSGISGLGSFPFFAAQAATNQFPVIGFELADCDQQATLAGLFDQYKIEEVEMIITPSNSGVDLHAAASPNQVNPQCIVVSDYDDATALASFAAAREYDNNVVFNGCQGVHIRMRPAISLAVYASGAFSGYAVSGPQWLDCNSNNIPHYGLKFAVQGLSTSSTEFYQWNIQTWYHLAFQNVR
jgi:hypothetical protein